MEDTGPDLPALFAAADTGKGERVFNKCKACHVLEDGQNGVGPHLYDVVGRDVGAVEGFGYSGALARSRMSGPPRNSLPFSRTRRAMRRARAWALPVWANPRTAPT